jgi:hypothetical protein
LYPPEGARAARLGPAPGDPWVQGYTEHYSQGKCARLELRFTDIAPGGVDFVTGALLEFLGEYAMVGDEERGTSTCIRIKTDWIIESLNH